MWTYGLIYICVYRTARATKNLINFRCFVRVVEFIIIYTHVYRTRYCTTRCLAVSREDHKPPLPSMSSSKIPRRRSFRPGGAVGIPRYPTVCHVRDTDLLGGVGGPVRYGRPFFFPPTFLLFFLFSPTLALPLTRSLHGRKIPGFFFLFLFQ